MDFLFLNWLTPALTLPENWGLCKTIISSLSLSLSLVLSLIHTSYNLIIEKCVFPAKNPMLTCIYIYIYIYAYDVVRARRYS